MQRFHLTDTSTFARDHVMDLAWQALHEASDLMPDIDAVSCEPCETDAGPGATVRERSDVWFGQANSHALRHLLDISAASWRVSSRWNLDTGHIDYRVRSVDPEGAVTAHGSLAFTRSADGGTDVALRGELSFHAGALGGALRFIAAAVAPLVEQTIVNLVERNVASLLGAVEGRLAIGQHAPAHDAPRKAAACAGHLRGRLLPA